MKHRHVTGNMKQTIGLRIAKWLIVRAAERKYRKDGASVSVAMSHTIMAEDERGA